MKQRLWLLASLLLIAAASTATAAPDRGFYIGAGAGVVNVKDDPTGFDDGDTGFKVFGGYVLNEILAVELSYIDGGTAEETGSVLFAFGPGSAKLQIDTSIINLSVLGDLLLTDQFSLFGRVGYAFINTDADATIATFGSSITRISDSDTNDEFSYGFGAVYRINEQLEVRAEFEGFDVSNGNLNAITASVLFRF